MEQPWFISLKLTHKPVITKEFDQSHVLIEIKERFEFADIKTALNEMKKDFECKPVDERCQNILKDILSLLHKINILMLLDEQYILHLSNKLAYNDVDWVPRDPKYILKELLQNADDAKATKMYFILDKRTQGTQGILSKKWEKLQGNQGPLHSWFGMIVIPKSNRL